MSEKIDLMEKIISLAKRRGFIYQGSDIYGGLSGTWDYGPLGVSLKNNIKNLWWDIFVEKREDMFGLDSAILMNQKVWQASGHAGGFADPVVEDSKTGKKYRADHLLEENGVSTKGMKISEMDKIIQEKGIKSPEGNSLGSVRQFNMMFKTNVGAIESEESLSYLRPETAQGIFVNFKNIVDSFSPKIPFGVGQIGKAFRNEIAPRDFIFRSREFEQMEVEYFVKPSEWESSFEEWRNVMFDWTKNIGLSSEKIHELEVSEEDRAHYSKRTIDIEYDFPFGRKELYGLAFRGDYDLSCHREKSGEKLEYFEQETGERFTPNVIEPSLGVDRTVLAVLCDSYKEDEIDGEKRIFLKFNPKISPVKVAIFPLLKNKPELVEKAREVYSLLKKDFSKVSFDDNGNIGKRYRRQDEIGTPFCITIDFETLSDESVTIRDRDTAKQIRIKISDLKDFLQEKLSD